MRLPDWLRRGLLKTLQRRTVVRRAPDFVIGEPESPYLLRWWVIPKNRWFNIYFHRFLRSDEDRALHDHPWWSASFILEGSYFEHVQGRETPHLRPQGHIGLRSGSALHRVELPRSEDTGEESPRWTMFLTGPKYRAWGFLCSKGWRHWETFCAPTAQGNTVGRGCD